MAKRRDNIDQSSVWTKLLVGVVLGLGAWVWQSQSTITTLQSRLDMVDTSDRFTETEFNQYHVRLTGRIRSLEQRLSHLEGRLSCGGNK